MDRATSSSPTSTSSPYSSTRQPSVSTASSTSISPTPTRGPVSNEGSPANVEAMVFGIIGGVVGGLLLVFISYRLIRRRQKNAQKRAMHETFWGKWHRGLGTYTPVQGDAGSVSHEINPAGGLIVNTDRGESEPPYSWWQKFNFSTMPILSSGEAETREKRRTGTLHRVKRVKPGEKFEIAV